MPLEQQLSDCNAREGELRRAATVNHTIAAPRRLSDRTSELDAIKCDEERRHGTMNRGFH